MRLPTISEETGFLLFVGGLAVLFSFVVGMVAAVVVLLLHKCGWALGSSEFVSGFVAAGVTLAGVSVWLVWPTIKAWLT